MTDPDRKPPGQFAKGSSGNPNGRPRKTAAEPEPAQMLRTLSDFSEITLRVAARMTPISENGKSEKVTLFEANVMSLATSGKNRLAHKDFVDLVNNAARQLDQARRNPKR